MIRIILALILFCGAAHAETLPTELTTPRGISVWYLKDATTPSVTISFAFRGGIEEDPADKQGRAFLMANMLTEGTEKLDSIAFQRLLSDNNISFGLSAGREAISGKLRFLTNHRDIAVALAHGALTQPAFRAADIARLQQGMRAGLNANESDPDWRAQRLCMQQLFDGSSYANGARGIPQTIANISASDLRTAQKSHLTRSRLLIAAVGAVDADTLGKVIDGIFADLPIGETWQAKQIQLKHRGENWYSNWTGSAQNTVLFAAPSISPRDPDYPAALVVNDILGGGGFRAALMDELRQALGATYGANTSLISLAAAPMMMGQTSVIADKTDDVIHIINDVWNNAATYLTPERIRASTTYLSGSLTNDLTSSSAIADYYLGLRLQHLPVDTIDRLPTQLNALSQDDILRVAKRLYNPHNLSYIVVGPAKPAAATRMISNIWTLQ